MSLKSLTSLLGIALVAALLFAALPLWLVSADPFDVEVRTVPWRTQTGRLTKASPAGQGFRATWDGLDRIDLALVALGPTEGAELELVLRRGARDGEVLRRVPLVTPPAGGRGWVSFEFEPVADSAGVDFWFELQVTGELGRSPYSPWLRYHGHPGEDTAWGNRILNGPRIEGILGDHSPAGLAIPTHGFLPAPNLVAVAFACDSLEPARGEVRFELWAEEDDPETSAPLRSVLLDPGEEVHGGWAYFAFEPLADSRHRRLRFRLTTGDAARLVGFESGPCVKTFHGDAGAAPPLLGMSRGDRLHGDRSLIFRAHGAPGTAQRLSRILDRAGWKLAAGALSWVLAVALLARLCTTR